MSPTATRHTSPAQDPSPDAERSPGAVGPVTLSVAAACAAAVLAATSTGSLVVVAVLLGIATRDRGVGLVALLATASVGIRFSTVVLDDLAGLQSVLGPAGLVGPETGAAAAWLAAGAVLLVARRPRGPRPETDPVLGDHAPIAGAWRWAPPAASGLVAAAIAAGPGPSDLLVRVGSSLVAVTIALLLSRESADGGLPLERTRLVAALVLAVAAVGLAGVPA